MSGQTKHTYDDFVRAEMLREKLGGICEAARKALAYYDEYLADATGSIPDEMADLRAALAKAEGDA